MQTVHTHTLGFPRIGARRELKTALESYWRGDIGAAALEDTARNLRACHWAQQALAGLDVVTVGDFALYDQVANHIQLFGCEPARFGFSGEESALDRYFAMARGDREHDAHCCGGQHNGHALDMTKWFDTNYHYLVPEFNSATRFRLDATRLLGEVAEAQAQDHTVKVALIGQGRSRRLRPPVPARPAAARVLRAADAAETGRCRMGAGR
jgi:5-methyltetrahydropteroyltriglutamate--homocysteine methyltransferase